MLIKALLGTRSPGLCALIYGAALFTNGLIFDLAFGGDWARVLGSLALTTVACYAFFWLLLKTEDMGPFYWITLVVGIALMGFVVP